jgi:apolipoprotein N-acyltransferase
LLLTLSYPPLHLLIPPLVGLVPITLWLGGRPAGQEGRAAAGRGAALFGVLYFGLVIHWVPVALSRLAGVPAATLAFAFIVIALAFMVAAFGVLLHAAVQSLGLPLWLALPVSWTALEWAQAHLPGSLAFPWLGLGTSLTGYPELVGIAEWVGARGVTFWLALVNGLIAHALLRRKGHGPWRRWLGAAAVTTAVPMLWGIARADDIGARPVARVAVVQPDIPWAPGGRTSNRDAVGTVERLVEGLEADSVDLVVLPEGFVDLDDGSVGGSSAIQRLQVLSRQLSAPILFGAVTSEQQGGRARLFNSALLMEPAGIGDFQYQKRHLVPLVEDATVIPMPAAMERLVVSNRYQAGAGEPVAAVAGVRFGVLICYESSFAESARAYRQGGAQLLMNITSDGWFGGALPGGRTVASWQHPAHLVMRAIELRTGAVRAANAGPSMFIDPVGRVDQRTEMSRPDVRVAWVSSVADTTGYARYGDVLGRLSALSALGLLVVAVLRARRGRSPGVGVDA